MDATPHLLTDVKFSERRKGYDPEEVDNFLAQVSEKVAQLQDMVREATARADEAEAKAADAQRAKEVAQARIDTLEADLARLGAAPRPLDEQEEVERASKILLMAQKTADATVEDANRTAQTTIAEARQQAASILADAEAEAEKLRVEAKRQIDELVQQRRGEILAEVSELERARDELSADVEALRSHLDTERQHIQGALDAIKKALDDPAGLRVAEPPPLRPVSLPEPSSVEDVPAPGAEEPASGGAGLEEGVVGVGDAPQETTTGATTDAGSAVSEPLGAAPATEEAPTELHPGPTSPDASASVPEGAPTDGEPTSDRAGDGGEGGSQRLFESAEPSGPPLDPGPATELFTPFPEEAERDDPLGQPDAEADAAMRAFFEADFEAEAEQKRSRWRR